MKDNKLPNTILRLIKSRLDAIEEEAEYYNYELIIQDIRDLKSYIDEWERLQKRIHELSRDDFIKLCRDEILGETEWKQN